MASLTRAQLLTQAGLAAGNDQSSAFVATWLDAWLKRTAKSWAWPVLKKQVVDMSAPAGGSSIYVGNGYATKILGVSATTNVIHRIFNPLNFYGSTKKQRGRVFIRELMDGNPDNDVASSNVSDRTGAPTTVKIQKNDDGSMILMLDPVPDKQYYLSFWVHLIPNSLANSTSIPWYPNDRTLLHACKCALLELDDGGEGGPAYEKAMQALGAMVVDDRDFDGEGPGDNQLMALDPSVFR